MNLSVHRYRQTTTFQQQQQQEKAVNEDETLLVACVDDGTSRRLRCLRAVSRSITRSPVQSQVRRDPTTTRHRADDDDDDDDDDRSVSSEDDELNTSTTYCAPAVVSHASSEVVAWRWCHVDTRSFVQHVLTLFQPPEPRLSVYSVPDIQLCYRVSFINAYIPFTR